MRIKVREAFGSLDDMLSKEEQKIVLDAYNAALKEALTYIQGALPEGYTPTQLSFGNPFYTSVGTEKQGVSQYDPDRFGPHLFNISVDFIDGDSPKVAFRVDTVDPETGETRVIKNLVYRDPFLEEFLGMSKPAFILRSTDADKLTDATRKAFKKTEDNVPESAGYRVSVNFTPEPPFGYGDQDFLFKGLDIVDEEFSFPSEKEAEEFAQDCANRMTARNQDLESDGLQDGEIRVYYTNRDYVDKMVQRAGKAYAALCQDYDPDKFPVLVARIAVSK